MQKRMRIGLLVASLVCSVGACKRSEANAADAAPTATETRDGIFWKNQARAGSINAETTMRWTPDYQRRRYNEVDRNKAMPAEAIVEVALTEPNGYIEAKQAFLLEPADDPASGTFAALPVPGPLVFGAFLFGGTSRIDHCDMRDVADQEIGALVIHDLVRGPVTTAKRSYAVPEAVASDHVVVMLAATGAQANALRPRFDRDKKALERATKSTPPNALLRLQILFAPEAYKITEASCTFKYQELSAANPIQGFTGRAIAVRVVDAEGPLLDWQAGGP